MDGIDGVAVECDDAVCVFEFVAYKFIGKYPPSAECTVAEGGSGSADGRHDAATDPLTFTKNNSGDDTATSNESQVQHSGLQPSPPPPPPLQQLHGVTDRLAVTKEPSSTGQNEQPSSADSLLELKHVIKSLPPPPDSSRLPRQQKATPPALDISNEYQPPRPTSPDRSLQPASAEGHPSDIEQGGNRSQSCDNDSATLPQQKAVNYRPKIVVTRMSSANNGVQYKNKNVATQSTTTSQQTVTNGGSQMGPDELYTHFGSTSSVNMEAHSMQNDGYARSNGHDPFPSLANGDNRSADNVSHHSTEV